MKPLCDGFASPANTAQLASSYNQTLDGYIPASALVKALHVK